MFRSIRYWLTLLFLAVLSVAVVSVYLVTVPATESRLIDERLMTLSKSAPLIQETLYASLRPDPKTGRVVYDREALEQQVRYLDSQLNARIVVLSANNAVMVDSRGTPAFLVADYPLLRQFPPRTIREVDTMTLQGTAYAYAVAPISRPGMGVITQVVLTSSLADVAMAVGTVKRQLALAAGLASGVAVVTAILASWLVSVRLRRIEQGSRAIASGDFGMKIPVGVRDEIGRLAISFNAMGTQLGDAFAQLATEKGRVVQEKQRMDLLLGELAEGVVAVSRDGRVFVANPSAARLLGMEISPGRSLRECLTGALAGPVEECLQQCRETSQMGRLVLEQEGAVLEVDAYYVGDRLELSYILIARDVTEQARLDRARRDFAANASHELKTPLFSLAGFLELLIEHDPDRETQQRFLRLMQQQTDRLTTLSARLLDLSRLDSGMAPVHRHETDMVDIARRALADHEVLAAERDVQLELESPSDELPFVCDDLHVKQILSILIDNAIKASPRGACVRIVLSADEQIRAIVTDEGCGVSEDEVERIFERFYRSTQSPVGNGSGLGLAIARELAAMVGGEVTAEATGGRGGRFCVTLPKG